MQRTDSPELLGNRYQLLDPIDEGGMGTVFRAFDCLNEQIVAIKRVKPVSLAPADAGQSQQVGATLEIPQTGAQEADPAQISGVVTLPMNPLETPQNVNAQNPHPVSLRLAQEFRLLASLRHPNIVSVLDYGFDQIRQPYLVMELLENAPDIFSAAQLVPFMGKIDLAIQLLQALIYLHRQTIIHCDLKPGNVLVVGNQVKVLDFGLALRGETQVLTAGTLAYIAPEILNAQPPTIVSDLYSIGVMIYEMFLGRHPFTPDDIDQLLDDILYTDPDLSLLEEDYPAFADIIARLMRKDPQERFQDAASVVQAVCEAVGQPLPPEASMVRESFLQAAALIGRKDELETLSLALTGARSGNGSAWLIGGETGVGKSRLLDEFRTMALVEGALVLRGQNLGGNAMFYQMWRDLLRPLVLSVKLSDLEAGILKRIIPDIGRLLNRVVPDVVPLVGEQEQQRLSMTIADVLQRQRRTLVLLMEDLHWAEESLAPLRLLSQMITTMPLMIVGTYRNDEYPYFYGQLPAMQHMVLHRLTEEEIAELSYTMLGEAGCNEALIKFLIEQTEGNTLFIVETLRSLAEEAGRLSDIDVSKLPSHVFSQGINTVIQQRLKRLPEVMQPFIQLAAVMGRTLDLNLFGQIYEVADYVDWLAQCVDFAIVEVVDENWCFTHDKIRESILLSLPPEQKSALHQLIAESIEAVYAGNTEYSPVLTTHWGEAGNVERSAYHAGLTARRANEACEYQTAVWYTTQALAYRDMLPPKVLLPLLLEYAVAQGALGDYAQAGEHYHETVELAAQSHEYATEAVALEGLGMVARRQGNYDEAKALYQESLAIYHEVGDRRNTAAVLNQLARLDFLQGHYDEIQTLAEEALAIFSELEDLQGSAVSLAVLSLVPLLQGDFEAARAYLESSLEMRRRIGDQYGTLSVLCDLGRVLQIMHENDLARDVLEEALQISRQTNEQWHTAQALNSLAQVALNQKDETAAQYYLSEALHIGRMLNVAPALLTSLVGIARLLITQGDYVRSAELIGLVNAQLSINSGFIELAMRPIWNTLKVLLTPEDFEQALANGSQFDLYATVDDLLAAV